MGKAEAILAALGGSTNVSDLEACITRLRVFVTDTDAVDEDAGSVSVSGYVSRADDLAAVKQRIEAVEGVKQAKADVQLRIWPHCEVVKVLAPYKARNADAGFGLAITPSTGHSDRFIEGENVIVKLRQAGYEGYLYVDYFTVNGDVAHIYPNTGEPDSGRILRAAEEFEVGATPARTWTVCPPFGQELITVIASPTPLFQEAPEEIQTAQDYLPLLKRTLDAQRGNAKVVASYLFMQTEPESDPAKKPAALAACQAPAPAADAATAEPDMEPAP